jgi:hypothetical protein
MVRDAVLADRFQGIFSARKPASTLGHRLDASVLKSVLPCELVSGLDSFKFGLLFFELLSLAKGVATFGVSK